MKSLLLIYTLSICASCFSESTNLVERSMGYILSAPSRSISQYTNEVDQIEKNRPALGKIVISTSGKVVSDNFFLNLLDTSPRIYLLSGEENQTNLIVILSMPPFPDMQYVNYASVDSYIFEKGNRVEFSAIPISKEFFKTTTQDYYIWQENGIPRERPEPFNIDKRLNAESKTVSFFILEDVFSFCSVRPDKRKNDWLFPFRNFEQIIVLKDESIYAPQKVPNQGMDPTSASAQSDVPNG